MTSAFNYDNYQTTRRIVSIRAESVAQIVRVADGSYIVVRLADEALLPLNDFRCSESNACKNWLVSVDTAAV